MWRFFTNLFNFTQSSNVSREVESEFVLLGEKHGGRGHWASPIQFIFCAMGSAFGLGNVYRFPALVLKHGGGTFIFAYAVIFLLVGFPTFFMEISVGQFTSGGPGKAFKSVAPIFSGLGYGQTVILFGVCTTYNVLFAYTLYYLLTLTQAKQSWATCKNFEEMVGSPRSLCFDKTEYQECEEGSYGSIYVGGECFPSTVHDTLMQWLDICLQRHQEIYGVENRKKLYSHPFCSMKLIFPLRGFDLISYIANIPQEFRFIQAINNCSGKGSFNYDLATLPEWTQMMIDLSGGRSMKMGERVSVVAERFNSFLDLKYPISRLQAFTLDFVPLICPPILDNQGSHRNCFIQLLVFNRVYPSQLFFKETFDSSSSADHLGTVNAQMVFCLFVSWTLMLILVLGGLRVIGTLIYLTVIYPFVFIILAVIVSVWNGWGRGGYGYIMRTEWCKLSDPVLWRDAIAQNLFSLSCAIGDMMTLASYNQYYSDIVRDAFIISISDVCFSLISGLFVFEVLGGFAHQFGSTIEEVIKAKPSLFFTTLAQAAADFADRSYWSYLLYIALGLLALSSQMVISEAIVQCFLDEYKWAKKHKFWVTLAFCVFGFCVGVPCVTSGGITKLGVISGAVSEVALIASALFQALCFAYFYGSGALIKDIELMLSTNGPDHSFYIPETMRRKNRKRGSESRWWTNIGKKAWAKLHLRWYFFATWTFTCPLGLLTLFIWEFMNKVHDVRVEIVSSTVESINLAALCTVVLFLVCGILWKVMRRKVRWRKLMKPSKDWGPALNKNRIGHYTPRNLSPKRMWLRGQ